MASPDIIRPSSLPWPPSTELLPPPAWWVETHGWIKHVRVPHAVHVLIIATAFGCNHTVSLTYEVRWEALTGRLPTYLTR